MPIKIFYSYSHKDENLRIQLETHLSILKQNNIIESWNDRKITAGEEWKGKINKHLDTSSIILLLVSPDFLASNYCYDVEMKIALERHESDQALVIPVILRAVDWEGAPFGKLQALPMDSKPITSWNNIDEAFADVAKGIRLSIEKLNMREKVRDIYSYGDKNKYASNLFRELISNINISTKDILHFLIMGKTGVGKSSTVNSLLGAAVATVSDFAVSTRDVEEYTYAIENIRYKIFDTPGLCDDIEDVGNDKRYIQLIKDRIKYIDSLWFVTALTGTRVSRDELAAIETITKSFGEKVWGRSVIIFTFSDAVSPKRHDFYVDERTKLIRKAIGRYAGESLSSSIPSVAISNISKTLHDGSRWIDNLFTKVFLRISTPAEIPFLKSMENVHPLSELEVPQKIDILEKYVL